MECEIHGEEGDFRCHVTAAERLAELDAIEDDERIAEAYVLGVQIAVTLTDPSGGDPSLQELAASLDEPAAKRLDRIVVGGADALSAKATGAREAVSDDALDHRWRAVRGNSRIAARVLVKRNEASSECVDHLDRQSVAVEEARHDAIGRQAAHVYGELHRLRIVLRRRPIGVSPILEPDHAQVRLGGEPA